MSSRVSANVIALNEEATIGPCLESLAWADEIVVLDGGSTDRTREVARRLGARVIEHRFDDFASQRNRALDASTGDWILSIDADERVPGELAAEIRATVDATDAAIAGFWVPMRTRLFGRWLRYSGTQHERKMRLFRRDRGRWQRHVHETVALVGPAGRLTHPIHHESTPDLDAALRKLNLYSSLEAARLAALPRAPKWWRPWLTPPVHFARLYFRRLGFLDGREGFQHCALTGLETLVAYRKLAELRRSRFQAASQGIAMDPHSNYGSIQIEAHRDTACHETVQGRVALVEHLIGIMVAHCGHPSRLLEIGCHNGMESKRLVERADHVVGLELGREYADAALGRGLSNFKAVVGDMHDVARLFAPHTFDVVFANNCLEHSRGRVGADKTLAGIRHILTDAGHLVGAVPLDRIGRHVPELEYHTWKVDEDELRDAIEHAGLHVRRWDLEQAVNVRFPGVHSPASLQRMVFFVATRQ